MTLVLAIGEIQQNTIWFHMQKFSGIGEGIHTVFGVFVSIITIHEVAVRPSRTSLE